MRSRRIPAARRRMRARSAPGSAAQAGCAARAAATAASTSAGPAMGSSASFSPVAGLIVISDSSAMASSARLGGCGGNRNVRRECTIAACALLLAALPFAARAAAEPESCRIVRFSDIGWTDVTATTGLASHLVRLLGYEPRVTVLSVPVTFASLKNRDIDVFLGNWMPAQAADLAPFTADGSVEVVRREPRGRQVHARRAGLPARGGPAGLRRHPALREGTEPRDLRHRAGQRRQPPGAGDDRGEPARARRLQAGRVERAGHARAGRARRRARSGPSCSSAGSRTR